MAKKKETTAGVFDVRNMIGSLMTIYGVILLIWGIVHYDAAAAAKTGDININLIVGIVLTCLGVFFLVWAKLRPQIVVLTLEEAEAEAAAKDVAEQALLAGDIAPPADDTEDK